MTCGFARVPDPASAPVLLFALLASVSCPQVLLTDCKPRNLHLPRMNGKHICKEHPSKDPSTSQCAPPKTITIRFVSQQVES